MSPDRRSSLATVALLALAPHVALAQQPASAGTPPRAALVARLDSIASAYVLEAPAAGVTVAVVRHGDTLLLKGYGERDRARNLPAEASTVYRIGSVTKQFTAAAVLKLVEEGKVRLSDPITTYLPQYPQWSAVTVRQLLTHTSGIPSYTSSPRWPARKAEDLTPAQIVEIVENDPFDFPAGTDWRYDNTGYVLLGMILDRVTGTPYASLMRREFFAPLGMSSATYCPSKPTDPSHALGYRFEGEFEPAQYLSLTQPFAAGALCMSVPDYLRWQAALYGGKIVSAQSLALMAGPETLTAGPKKDSNTGYGMGLMRGTVGRHPTIQHGGSINGFSSQQYWFPAESLSVVAFVNTVNAEQDWLVKNLASAVFGMPLTPRTPPVVPLAAADRTKYVGDYDIGLPDGRILGVRIYARGDDLIAEPEQQDAAPLHYFGDDTFGVEGEPTIRLHFEVKDGKVVGGTLEQRGMLMHVFRRP
ncbi:MAG TPA: serine hydrolase domain-containing protein [Gemmatimonadaceae bacterium]|jgi:CubicO group peptidase (beta-lactamase class C family)|nr:serine hydrolase domain-containing protein [Gemmatimonadaceae bacterium]